MNLDEAWKDIGSRTLAFSAEEWWKAGFVAGQVHAKNGLADEVKEDGLEIEDKK